MTLPIALLLMACTALSLSAVVVLGVLLLRRKREEADAAERLDRASTTLDEKLHAANLLTAVELVPIAQGLEKLRSGMAGYTRAIEDVLAKPRDTPEVAGDPVALEREILDQSWKKFRADPLLSAALDDALKDRAWTELIDQLTSVVPTDLRPTYDAVIAPCRDHRTLLQQMDLIPRVVNGTLPRQGSTAAQVWFTRELASLLAPESASRLGFRFKSWVTDTFLPFADLYLQRCQQSDLEHGDPKLDIGADLVRRVLLIAAVEPIDVMPGETQFDSTRHIGRSTSNDPRFADGVITGVIRNGFIEGQQVIRQPEVIVNRVR